MLRTVSSLDGLRLAPQPRVQWGTGVCPTHAAITVLTEEFHQTIGGFGASMLEAGAINMNALPASKQDELLELLFGHSGARLSAMKATMLSNDFSAAAPWSTYDDIAKDTSLAHFSLARDLQPNGSLTYIKRAIAAGFEGTIQAYMDFPPDWMLTHDPTAEDHGRVAPQFYAVLARYFAKYVQGYAAHGVRIGFLEAFNEPLDSYVNETADTLATILGEHIGPTFERLGLWPNHTRLSYGGQCSRQSAGEIIPRVLAHPAAARYTDVLPYHGYDCQFEDDGSCTDERQQYDTIARLAARFPGRPLWMTEVCYAYNGDDPNCTKASTMAQCTDYPRDPSLAPPLPRQDFADGATWGHRIVRELEAGASGWIYWNLLLDRRGGPYALSPAHGDAADNWQHPVVVVDTEQGTFEPTGLFYFLAHFSRFVRPGATRLGTRQTADLAVRRVSAVAFASGSSSSAEEPQTVMQLVNRGTTPQRVAVCAGDGRVADVVLPAVSITTATWDAL